jgi:hypothetical protein
MFRDGPNVRAHQQAAAGAKEGNLDYKLVERPLAAHVAVIVLRLA